MLGKDNKGSRKIIWFIGGPSLLDWRPSLLRVEAIALRVEGNAIRLEAIAVKQSLGNCLIWRQPSRWWHWMPGDMDKRGNMDNNMHGIEQDLNNTFFIFILIHFTSMCCALIGPKRKNPNGLAMSYSL